MNDEKIIKTLRAMVWQCAKGELYAYLETFFGRRMDVTVKRLRTVLRMRKIELMSLLKTSKTTCITVNAVLRGGSM